MIAVDQLITVRVRVECGRGHLLGYAQVGSEVWIWCRNCRIEVHRKVL